ncbi:MAG: TAT-variant-translocated molybdopterin oxidoreductase [Caldilineaceae bacterium]|nr:TAT-variant-translocated molybdopterin oxidoreductase [Caldilineaceae bacterium]
MTETRLDLTAIQAQLANAPGRHFWRSLEELAETDAFREFLYREFPQQASEWVPAMSRRHFLQLMGASLALAGLAGCTSQSSEKIVPYVQAPEESVPGQPLLFATAMQLGGYALGLLAQSQLYRPTKVEGNPDHPSSLGATDCVAQASILTLYDPDRAKEVTHEGAASNWEAFLDDLQPRLAQQRASGGAGLRILTETVTSPTLFHQLQAVLSQFPNATWHQYEPVNRDNVYAGAQVAFGAAVEPIYRFDQADVIVSLDADFVQTSPGRVRYARDFAARRRADIPGASNPNRLYAIESTPTLVGAMADHRLPLRANQVEVFARALATELGVTNLRDGETDDGAIPAGWVRAIARDLQAHPGTTLVLAGDHQPPAVHALAHLMNDHLGNAGQTVFYTAPVVANPVNQAESLRELVAAMAAGQVEMLLVLSGNPVYYVPADLDFAAHLAQVPFRVHLGLYADETGLQCHWQIPEAHYLEAWSDARGHDGVVTIQQPLIEPLYASRSAHELLHALLGEEPRSDYELVRAYWAEQHGETDFEAFWRTALHDGVVLETAPPAVAVAVQPAAAGELSTTPPASTSADELEINFRPDPAIWDGRYANNGWLQELPRPLTKLTWENAALISPVTAAALGLTHGDVVELVYRGRVVQAPLWLLPGHCEGSVTVYLGYGRTHAGHVGNGAGFSAYALRTADAPWFDVGLTVQKVGEGYRFATTQLHHTMEGRDLIRVGTVAQFEREPDFAQEMDGHGDVISLYPKVEHDGNAWGMSIDLNACNGCNACVIACQAENNIPIVGKDQVARGREMHWIRLDRYYQGDLANPETYHQPVMCMHCEQAPCEVVCPVGATLHDEEGLNTMVYNRCIGTRYCSNNCPYKVRRFNFLEYTDFTTESLKLQRNPNVTVRARGVMEKCTYCVQRISAARIASKVEGRQIQDGEVVTACQAACPTQAIVFGNINDPESQVAKRKASPLSYGLLTELNTQPRTTYLAKLRNPNPELEAPDHVGGSD